MTNQNLRLENKKLHDEKTRLQRELDKIYDELQETAQTTVKNVPIRNKPNNNFNIKPQREQIYNTFYMPISNRNGSFDNSYKSSRFDWTESVYKFEVINEEGTKALISVVDDPRMVKRALNGYDTYIRPVCKGANAFNINATSIKTERKGRVSLNDDTWELESRAVIRYRM